MISSNTCGPIALTVLPSITFIPSTLFTAHCPFLRALTTRRVPVSAMSTYGGGQGVTVPARPREGKRPATLVFLHGLGDTGAGWAPAFPLPGLEHMKVVLPTADMMPVALNTGLVMPSWFDLHGLSEDAPVDKNGIGLAVQRLGRIVEEEIASGVERQRVICAGFSQGGSVALTYGLRVGGVGGLAGLSTWLPPGVQEEQNAKGAGIKKILMCHGEADPMVDCSFGKKSAEALRDLGLNVDFRTFPGLGHSSNVHELHVLIQFLRSILED